MSPLFMGDKMKALKALSNHQIGARIQYSDHGVTVWSAGSPKLGRQILAVGLM